VINIINISKDIEVVYRNNNTTNRGYSPILYELLTNFTRFFG